MSEINVTTLALTLFVLNMEQNALRLYESVFLGPLEQAKPWNTAEFRVYLVS
jgi:hypothetical protein